MADDDSFRLPLYCPLIVNGEEGKAVERQTVQAREPGRYPPGCHHRRARDSGGRSRRDRRRPRRVRQQCRQLDLQLQAQGAGVVSNRSSDARQRRPSGPGGEPGSGDADAPGGAPHRGRGRHLRFLRGTGRQAVWRELHPAQRLHDQPGQGAGGRGGDDHPLELPFDSDRPESGPRPCRRLHHRDQAGELHSGRHLRTGQAHPAGRSTEGCAQPGPGSRECRRLGDHRQQEGGQDLLHRRDRHRQDDRGPGGHGSETGEPGAGGQSPLRDLRRC